MSASVQINSLPANGSVASNAAAQNSEKMAYYALKTTGLVLGVFGVVVTIGAATWAWPKVVHWIAEGSKGTSPSQSHAMANVISMVIKGYIELVSACAKMGGDTGGFAAGFVFLAGLGFLLFPAVITFGSPLVPGVALTAGGVALWNYADKFKR